MKLLLTRATSCVDGERGLRRSGRPPPRAPPFGGAATEDQASAIVLVLEFAHHLDAVVVRIMPAVAAPSVARLLEMRSIYSGRIHAGTEAARRGRQLRRISSATRHVELLHALLRIGPDMKPPKAIDEAGEPIGEIQPEQVESAAGPQPPP